MDGLIHTDENAESEAAAEILAPEMLGMAGGSSALRAVRRKIRDLAPLPAPVLVTGESGVGKELVARALHDRSPRSAGPYVALNAAALPPTLIASELFGHERGAFTGARARRAGLFEQAAGGTLFLDEIGDMPLELQAWLLRVLESGEVRAVGATRARAVDVRIVAATNVDLEQAVRERRFRADLYWRLAVLTIDVPPLRLRREDVAPIAEHILAGLALPDRHELALCALQALALHAWPGNVRELRAVILRAVALAGSTRLDARAVVAAIGPKLALATSRGDNRNAVASALAATRGNVTAAARMVGVPRTTLRDRLRARARGKLLEN